MRHKRAVLFDLDDTLYSLSRFVQSGFRAVAAHVEQTRGIERHRVLAALMHASSTDARGRELQAMADRFALSSRLVPKWVEVIRAHRPSIRLPRQSAVVLRELRREWQLAVITNGVPAIQARKIDALGLTDAVDVVIFANEHGSGRGKPEPAPFLEALRQLDVRAARSVFVGDDERCDLAGASRVGMHTIWYAAGRAGRVSRHADAVVGNLVNVPAIAAALVGAGGVRVMRHVA